jgi:hypothetical protein
MKLQEEVDREQEVLGRITAVARRESCPAFGDLFWDWDAHDFDPWALIENPGVMFVSSIRCVVFQHMGRELRYYAGGWSTSWPQDPEAFHAAQDRKYAEGCEMGVFGSVRDALAFAEQYLVERRGFEEIVADRNVVQRRSASWVKAEDGSAYPA